jgi:hypothetical protein
MATTPISDDYHCVECRTWLAPESLYSETWEGHPFHPGYICKACTDEAAEDGQYDLPAPTLQAIRQAEDEGAEYVTARN